MDLVKLRGGYDASEKSTCAKEAKRRGKSQQSQSSEHIYRYFTVNMGFCTSMDISKLLCVAFLCLSIFLKPAECSDTGYCQVYSYNIKYRSSGLQEKHLFVCCNNGEEKQCEGATYQKPSRREGKLTGSLFKEDLNKQIHCFKIFYSFDI